MKQTQKYSGALRILTFPHSTQDELYAELNRLGWFWQSKSKEWRRSEQATTTLVKVRVMGATTQVSELAQHFVEAAGDIGLRLLEQSAPYPCRPPNNNESRIYLSFENDTQV